MAINFVHVGGKVYISLFVSGCEWEILFVCVLCEISWQQTMGGQGHCKHARETGGRMLFEEYKKWSFRAKKERSIFCC